MAKKIQSIKGFYDVAPERQKLWRYFEATVLSVLDQYHYQEIGLPMVEPTDLFVSGVGTQTDIVEKEMYSWIDPLNKDSLTLRPEGTAGCVRAVIEGSLTYNGPTKLFYRGPMFRHENVQKGRQRQFHQIGVEAFGLSDASSDAEQILLLSRLWKALGLTNITLELNSIGDPADREAYRKVLIAYFEDNKAVLDEDAQRRLYDNPLRILDSKNPSMQDMLNSAPKLRESISAEAHTHFDSLCQILDNHGVPYKLNDRLVRGLDYYNRTCAMFESCLPTIKRKSLCDLGFGCVPQTDEYQYWNALPIAASGEKRVIMKPMISGLKNCGKLLMGSALEGDGLQIQLHLADGTPAARLPPITPRITIPAAFVRAATRSCWQVSSRNR